MDYINLRQIVDDLKDETLMEGLTYERAINYAVNFIRKLGIPKTFEDKIATVNIVDYRGELPCDLLYIQQVRDKSGKYLIAATDSFNNRYGYTYKVQGNIIFTSLQNTSVDISYKSILVDEDGFPLIPDNGTFSEALELYIQKKYLTKLFREEKIRGDVLEDVKKEYAWAVGQARADLTIPSIDEMESLKNMWCSRIEHPYKHSDGFSTLNHREQLKH